MREIVNLEALRETCGAEAALVINSGGELLEAINMNHEDNIAAMTGVITKMAQDLSEDLNINSLKQFMIRSEKGIFIVNKFSNDFIVGLFSEDVAKAGIMMLSLNNFKLKS